MVWILNMCAPPMCITRALNHTIMPMLHCRSALQSSNAPKNPKLNTGQWSSLKLVPYIEFRELTRHIHHHSIIFICTWWVWTQHLSTHMLKATVFMWLDTFLPFQVLTVLLFLPGTKHVLERKVFLRGTWDRVLSMANKG